MSDGKFFAIYVRVSSMEQAQSKEGSIKSQIQRCTEYLRFKYGDKPVVIFREEGRSGKDTNRPEYQKLLCDVRRGKIEAVTCTELSRISRSVMDFHNFMAICNKHEVGFISLREQFDTTTAHGKLMIGIFALFAQFEREQISERTSANLYARAKRGLYNGGYVYGYRPRPGQPGYIDPDPNEAIIIQAIFQKYLEIGSYCLVAKWLNEHGNRTREYTTRTGKLKMAAKWNDSSVIQVLRNPIYIGKRKLTTGEVVNGVWDPIITTETFTKTQELLARNYHARGNTVANVQHTYLFGGILYCTHCAQFFESGSGTGSKGKTYFYYRHPGGQKRPGCPHPSFPAQEIEHILCTSLTHVIDQPDIIQGVCEEYQNIAREQEEIALKQIQSIDNQIKTLDSESAALVQKLPLLKDEQITEFVSPRLQDISNRKKDLKNLKDELTSRHFHLSQETISPEDIRRSFAALSKDFWLLNDREKKELISALVEKIELHEKTLVVWIREVSSDEKSSNDTLGGCPCVVSGRTFPIEMRLAG